MCWSLLCWLLCAHAILPKSIAITSVQASAFNQNFTLLIGFGICCTASKMLGMPVLILNCSGSLLVDWWLLVHILWLQVCLVKQWYCSVSAFCGCLDQWAIWTVSLCAGERYLSVGCFYYWTSWNHSHTCCIKCFLRNLTKIYLWPLMLWWFIFSMMTLIVFIWSSFKINTHCNILFQSASNWIACTVLILSVCKLSNIIIHNKTIHLHPTV